jgi:hypothetical protein
MSFSAMSLNGEALHARMMRRGAHAKHHSLRERLFSHQPHVHRASQA